ncbi:MAG: hypothetical protein ACI9TH_000600 [Kiritimatiellia bacterium]
MPSVLAALRIFLMLSLRLQAEIPVAPGIQDQIKQIWSEHLHRGIKNNPKADAEWLARAALRADAADTNAVGVLVHHYIKGGEFIMAAASAEYGRALGFTNYIPSLTYFRENLPSWIDDKEIEFINASLLEMLKEQNPESPELLTPEQLRKTEARLRRMLLETGSALNILKELATLRYHQDDYQMSLMLTSLLVYLDPLDQEVIHLHFKNLPRFENATLMNYYIDAYMEQPKLPSELNARMGEWCLGLNRKKDAATFFKRWTDQQPDAPEPWEKLGTTLYDLRETDEAFLTLIHCANMECSPAVYRILAEIASKRADGPGMVRWLTRYREAIKDDDTFLDLLTSPNFSRYPSLLKELK